MASLTRHPRPARLALALALLLAVVWPDAADAAPASVAIERLLLEPATLAPGQTLRLTFDIRARRRATVAVEATVSDATGQSAWRQSWSGQGFGARQRRVYTATWTPPRDLGAGAYRLVVRVRDGAGAEAAPARQARLRLLDGAGAGAPVGATPTPTATPPSPSPTPSPAGSLPVAVTGSPAFVAGIRTGLELMRSVSPADYGIVATYVTEIREGPQNWATGGSRVIQISAVSATYSRPYAGSIVLHEAVHVKNWFTDNQPVFGCDGEAKSLRAQADYLLRAGDAAMARWVEGLIGTWC